MTKRISRAAALGGWALLMLCAAAADTPTTAPTMAPATQPTTRAAVPLGPPDRAALKLTSAGKPDARFLALHAEFLDRAWQAPIGLLFLGDSITEGWRNAPQVWKEHYWPYAPADFGIGGDRTEHVLWRIDHHELDHIEPKVVVLMIGTNNIGSPAEQIAAADVKIVHEIHQKLPNSKLLLLGIFPRAQQPTSPMRDKIKVVNAELAKLDDGTTTRYLDIGDKFLDADGVIQPEIMKDFLHPTPKGYQIWADAMQPLLDEMMK